MLSLVERLCYLLDCPASKLAHALRDVDNYQKVFEDLSRSRLLTTHLRRNRKVKFSGLSLSGADTEFAYRGYLNVTVQQHMYCRHGFVLRLADAPCVEERGNRNRVSYWPIECLMWEPVELYERACK